MLNAVYIMWLRQIKKHFRSKARMFSSLGQPLLFLFALWFGFGPIFQKAGGGNYLEFLAPGIVSMTILFTSVFTGMEVIWDRQFGFLKETLVAPVSRLSIFFGRTLGGATVALFQGVLVLLITFLVGFKPVSIAMIPAALVVMFLISILFTALGTAIASLLEDMNVFPIIINFLIMPLFFLSGALFPLDGLPKSVVYIFYADPLSYGVDALRLTLTNLTHFGFFLDILVLVGSIGIISALGAYLFSRIQV